MKMPTAVLTLPSLHQPDAAPAPSVVRQASGGDHEAFQIIHRRYHASVHRLLGELLRDRAAVDDATQETFVRAFLRLHTLRDEQRLHGWLLGIARRVAHEQRRSRWRLWPAGSETPVREQDLAQTPEETALGRESGRALEWALRKMREERRVALLLRADQGLSCEDVAEALGWSLTKTKVELHRARHELRDLMSRYSGQGNGGTR